MATLKEVKRMCELCERYGLEGRELIGEYTNAELGSMYNGIGPERFPGWLRSVLDALHPSLAPVAFIHDIEWTRSDGTGESFAASNRRFRRNGWRIAKAMYGWWRPRRYAVMWDAWKFSRICQRFGWAAWIAPFEARGDAKGGEVLKHASALLSLGLALGVLAGCASQSIVQREYYEPDERTAYTREDGLTVGAVKTEVIRSGSPDWSDSKTISLISVGR